MTSAGPSPDLTVSVVTFQSADCLDGLLESIRAQTGVNWELRIADNASTDATCERLRVLDRAHIICNETNVGFGRAHNQNIRAARGRHVLVLNPDVRFGDGVFARLVNALDRDAKLGAAGPAVVEGVERTVFQPRRFYPGEGMVALQPIWQRQEIAWTSGCALALRRDALQAVGGFDERFFLYSEEADLCLRLRRAGWRIAWVRDAEVHHAGFESQREATGYERACRLFRGTALFCEIHYSEDAVRSMMRFQALSAGALGVLMRVTGRQERDAHDPLNAERLLARRDVARQWLRERGLRPGVDRYTWRIVARQAGIAREWLRLRRFPLDDF